MAEPWDIIVTDIETDGLIEECTVTHCASIIDVVTKEVKAYRPDDIGEYLEQLKKAKVYINHNIIGFDFPALEKLYGFEWNVRSCIDTLVISRTLYPDRPQGHSLKSWGLSLGVLKGDFGETNDWSKFTEDMLQYNIQDCKVTLALFERQMAQIGWNNEHLLQLVAPNGERWMEVA